MGYVVDFGVPYCQTNQDTIAGNNQSESIDKGFQLMKKHWETGKGMTSMKLWIYLAKNEIASNRAGMYVSKSSGSTKT